MSRRSTFGSPDAGEVPSAAGTAPDGLTAEVFTGFHYHRPCIVLPKMAKMAEGSQLICWPSSGNLATFGGAPEQFLEFLAGRGFPNLLTNPPHPHVAPGIRRHSDYRIASIWSLPESRRTALGVPSRVLRRGHELLEPS